MNRLQTNIASLFALQGANYLLPLIAVPYLVRVLGPENFGRVAFAQAFIQYFVLLTDFGFNFSATRGVALCRGDAQALSKLFGAVMAAKAVFMSIGFLVMLTIVNLVPVFQPDKDLYVVVYLSVVGSVLYPTWLFQGLERMRQMALITIMARAITVMAIFLFVRHSADFLLAAAIQASTLIIGGIAALSVISHVMPPRLSLPRFSDVRDTISDGWHVFLSTAAVSLYTSSNVFILGLLVNPVAVGYFSAAEKVIKAVQGLITPVSQAVYPHIAAIGAQSKAAALSFISKLVRFQGMATLILSVTLFFLAGPLVELLLGKYFEPSIELVRWMAALPFVIGLSNVFGVQVMLNFDMKHVFTRILILSGVLNITLIIPLVIALGARGAAISVLLTETAVTILMAFALSRKGLMRAIAQKAPA